MAAALALISLLFALVGIVELVLFLCRLHVPFTATGEALIYLGTFGRRRPRFTWIAEPRQRSFTRDVFTVAAAAALGIAFWISVVVAILCIFGPFPPVHQW